MPHETNEVLRKSIHIAVGFGAIALRFFTWPVVAAVCVAAVASNWLLLHRVFGKRVARHEQGWDWGIVLYPAMVLVLVLLFRDDVAPIAIGWTALAFGDGFAGLAGKSIGGPRLPWNRGKTWSGFFAFLCFGFAGSLAMVRFLDVPFTIAAIAVAIVVAGIVESLQTNIDDNIGVTLSAGVTAFAMLHASAHPVLHLDATAWVWIGVNAALAIIGYAAKSVDVSGMVTGFLLGAVLIVFGGWPLYATLLAFFILGTATTKLGYRRKAARGLAQEKGGRRGFSHAFANVGAAAILAIASAYATNPSTATLCWLAAVAALATAGADTTASEVGQLLGRRTFLPLTFRPVAPGTEGAISVEGTIAGLIAGVAIAAVGVWGYFASLGGHMPRIEWQWIACLGVAAFAGSYVESVIGSWNRKRARPVPNGVLNFVNTCVGAALVLAFFGAVVQQV